MAHVRTYARAKVSRGNFSQHLVTAAHSSSGGVNGLSLFIRSNESLSGIASLFSYDFGSVAVDHRPVPSKIPNSGVILPLIYFCAEEL